MSKPPEPPPIPLDFEAKCEVELTRAQRDIVYKETGREMEILVLEDSDAFYTQRMPFMEPEEITILALKQAEALKQYDEDYHAYLLALAAWQEEGKAPDPVEEAAKAAEIAAMQEAERLKLFFMREEEECQQARELAKIAWNKKEKA